ncbi:MAG: YcgL domain-containing protein [Oceanicoccus sp.]|uniref:YcgL domain-containing protein n=1 Tax=Oceanicoccus sp. TaxID=2691044 RepID=UPI00260C2F05|nr:YcgL domain-containing protein [Oceanicoccus sp.]MCP3907584.1 YcgL domain-containing protein [Oceanicoccus sp.]MDG1773677.1 YcgL domain-containing protein [Oceanicoccus sp.]
MKKICTIYRSPKQEGMYLYVDKQEDLERIPAALLKRFGKPEQAMTLVLTPERELARVDIAKVLASLEEQGFFLQMPPQPDKVMQKLHEKNSKM